MISITCNFRPLLRSGGKEGKLFLRIIHNRKVGSITLPFNIYSSEWDPINRQFLLSQENSDRQVYIRRVKEHVDKETARLYKIANDMGQQRILSVNNLLKAFRTGWHQRGLNALTDYLSRELYEGGQYRTARAYKTALRRILGFSGNMDCAIENITEDFLMSFEEHMRSEKMAPGTISFYMRILRAIFNKGIKLGFFTGMYAHEPFRKVYTKIPKTKKKALGCSEIKKLGDLMYTEEVFMESGQIQEQEKRSLKLFMFAFHAQGMSFVDLAYLKKKDLSGNILTYYRHKTKQYVRVVLTTEAMRLLNDIRSNDFDSPFLIPLIKTSLSNGYIQYCNALRKQNYYLKRIAGRAGIEVSLSTHMARHSWATIAKKENVPIAVISESLGHTSLATTYIYLDSFNASDIEKANRKVDRAVKRKVAG